MKDLSPAVLNAIGLLALTAAASSLMMIGWVARRVHRGRPVLPYEPRRPVPWGFWDVVAVAAIYLASLISVQAVGAQVFGGSAGRPAPARVASAQIESPRMPGNDEKNDADKDAEVEHPLVTLIRENPSRITFLLALLTGVVMAPIVEEFLFRLVLQGWLEAVERRVRRLGRRGRRTIDTRGDPAPALPPTSQPGAATGEVNPYSPPLTQTARPACDRISSSMPPLVQARRSILGRSRRSIGVAPVLATSIFFAALHFREAMPTRDVDVLTRALVYSVLAGLLTVVGATVYLRLRSGATFSDFGIVPGRFWGDVRLGLLAFLTIAAPIYLLQFVWRKVLPENIAPDPFTLAFFAMVLGVLYFRTHRLVPSITLHMALNATSLALAWLVYGTV